MNTTMTQEPTVRPRVLVATDLGEWGDAAVREADRWARGMDADLTVLHCVPIHAPISPLLPQLAGDMAGDLEELERRAGDAVVERVATLTGRSPDEFQVIVEAGTPHVEIVRTAEAEGASLVVVGARGSSGLMRALEVDGVRPSPAELLARAEQWRPWRAYAALHLWASDTVVLKAIADAKRAA